ncbi:hypothetical protein C8R45DRAFT_1186592 [Mycena sanguinolenta]|nr:hypothetical protein C8R45DRAFT_1186592 [Mycena sanguinolenta]
MISTTAHPRHVIPPSVPRGTGASPPGERWRAVAAAAAAASAVRAQEQWLTYSYNYGQGDKLRRSVTSALAIRVGLAATTTSGVESAGIGIYLHQREDKDASESDDCAFNFHYGYKQYLSNSNPPLINGWHGRYNSQYNYSPVGRSGYNPPARALHYFEARHESLLRSISTTLL